MAINMAQQKRSSIKCYASAYIYIYIYIDDSTPILFLLDFFSISVKTKRSGITDYHNNEGHNEDLELPFFDLSTIVCATENFAINRKIGEGGFGSVYMVSL